MQNVIPLFQRGLDFKRVVMVASAEGGRINPRFERVAADLQSALSEKAEWILHSEPVDPMSPDEMKAVCGKLLHEYGGPDQVAVNFTGGTKPMSIGAFQAGEQVVALLMYVDTQTARIFFYNGGRTDAVPFDLEDIGVVQILQAHGKWIDERHTAGLRFTPEELQLGELIREKRPQSFMDCIALRESLLKMTKTEDGYFHFSKKPEQISPWLADALGSAGLLQQAGKQLLAENSLFGFMDGNWLEAYVYQALEQSGSFADVAARLKIAGVENELDVACMLDGRLGIIECKGGSLKGQTGQAALNRLRALRGSLGGLFAQNFLVTAQSVGDLSPVFQRRADEYVSRVIGLDDLARVEMVIASALGSRRR